MAVKGAAIGKHKPCKWCGSRDTVVGPSMRVMCNDCGKTTGIKSNRYRALAEEEKMKRPWCIKDKVPLRSKSKGSWSCESCGFTVKKEITPRMIRYINLAAVNRPDCPYCGRANPNSHRNDWRCTNPKCREYWPKEPKEDQLPSQPIEEVLIS